MTREAKLALERRRQEELEAERRRVEEEAEKAQAEEAERQRRREESERDLQRQLGKFSMHIITPHKRLPIFCKVTMSNF